LQIHFRPRAKPPIVGELFKMKTVLDLPTVQYRGGEPLVADLLGGHVQAMFNTIANSIEHIKAARLRALAIASATRSELLPDIPIMADYVPGVEASSWYGIVAPRNTPAAIVDKLNKEINVTLADPRMKARLADLAFTVPPLPRPSSDNSSPRTPKNGARWSSSRA
jgi:tripartite-type tricarboxylate transporter receptor subunit TctC